MINSSTPLWYLTRATGLVALVLLTASMALGLLSSVKYQRPGLAEVRHRRAAPERLAARAGLHRDPHRDHAGRHLRPGPAAGRGDPFISAYRPLWLGLGAIAFDLMLALTITSLLRTRMRYRTWLLVHWGSYLCWPVAVLHGLGTGSDTPVHWVLALTLACVGLIVVLTAWRLADGWPSHAAARLAGALALLLALVVGGAWLTAGPLQPGWARRSGTPTHLLNGGVRAGATTPARGRR